MDDASSSSRTDGRAPLESRPFTVKYGGLHRADGSARVALGPLSLVASFSGPMEVRIRDERLDRATLEVHHRPLDGTAGITSKAVESALETSLLPLLQLTSHPRSLVLLTIQALSAPPLPVLPKPVDPFDPSPLASPADLASSAAARRKPSVAVPTSEKALALTAASLAAMDAGSIGLTAVALGACCAVLADGSWVVDPDYDEERSATAVFGVGWAFGAAVGVEAAEDGAGREVVWLESDGDFDEDDLDHALDLTLAASRQLLSQVRSMMEAHFGLGPADADDDSAMVI